MNYTVVYASKTGNTAFLANSQAEALPGQDIVCLPAAGAQVPDSDILFVGFWTDKGDCDPDTAAFLAKLQNKRVFLFGTAGFGGDPQYFSDILGRVRAHLAPSNLVIGHFMCQGRMPDAVRRRFEALPPKEASKQLENFDRALSHPDDDDAAQLVRAAIGCL